MIASSHLQTALQAKFAEIEATIAKDTGLGEASSLNQQEREQLSADAEEAIENWQLAEHVHPSLEAKTRLQLQLAEYVEIGNHILDLRDLKDRES